MIVVDSSAFITIPRREPEADSHLQVIALAEGCLLSSVSLLVSFGQPSCKLCAAHEETCDNAGR